jgi:hypothetical protein
MSNNERDELAEARENRVKERVVLTRSIETYRAERDALAVENAALREALNAREDH